VFHEIGEELGSNEILRITLPAELMADSEPSVLRRSEKSIAWAQNCESKSRQSSFSCFFEKIDEIYIPNM